VNKEKNKRSRIKKENPTIENTFFFSGNYRGDELGLGGGRRFVVGKNRGGEDFRTMMGKHSGARLSPSRAGGGNDVEETVRNLRMREEKHLKEEIKIKSQESPFASEGYEAREGGKRWNGKGKGSGVSEGKQFTYSGIGKFYFEKRSTSTKGRSKNRKGKSHEENPFTLEERGR